jgi:lysozyme family protein
MDKFATSYQFTKKWEGGYVFDATDRGGETKYGISKRSYPHLNIKNLTMEDAERIYKRDFWDAMLCDEYTWPLCLVIFDTAVNVGVHRCRKWVERLKGDDAIKTADLLKTREDFYKRIAERDPTQKKFLKGWLNRINDLKRSIGYAR